MTKQEWIIKDYTPLVIVICRLLACIIFVNRLKKNNICILINVSFKVFDNNNGFI